MTLKILSTRPATDDEWDTIWQNCEYATYFHSREWAELWQKYTHRRIRPAGRMITFSDGTCALLPFSSRNLLLGFLKQAVSSPAGTFGGWLSVDVLTREHASLLYENILENNKNLVWRINPIDMVVRLVNIEIARQDHTQVLNLEQGFDAVYKNWTKGHSSAARKASREGVRVKQAVSIHDWKDYYRVYESSLDRWGDSASSHYEWSLFQEMFELRSSAIKLWLALYQDEIIAGALCMYAWRHVVYWHGAALSTYFNLRPVNLLIYEIIKDTCERGYQWFDFNPSGGHEGVENFKRSFGTQSIECPLIINSSNPVLLIKKILGREQ